jgi:hypothetical protein
VVYTHITCGDDVWYPIGWTVEIGRIEIRDKMKTTTVATEVVSRNGDRTGATGENKTEEDELITTTEVQVVEVSICFLSGLWWSLFLPPALT